MFRVAATIVISLRHSTAAHCMKRETDTSRAEDAMNDKYRLERWIAMLLVTLFALPFVGTAEEFYANRLQHGERRIERVKRHAAADHVALPEESVPNAIDAEP